MKSNKQQKEPGNKTKTNQLPPAQNKTGFTIIEVLVATAIFAVILTGFLGTISALSSSVKAVKEKIILASLANNYMEVVRNLPYTQVGTLSGNPHGNLPDLANATTTSISGMSYKIFYEVTYIDDPADGLATGTIPVDFEAADYKQVKMDIQNTTTGSVTSFATTVVPKGLEGTLNAGALYIKVINATGQPVPDASIQITGTSSSLNLSRSSDATGNWVEVGLSAGSNAYHIVVTKPGYSTDQTYPISVQNPNPTKPDVTILDGKVTQVTFSIDLLSTLTIITQDQYCHALNNVGLNVSGAKLIGTSPNVYKFNQSFYSGPSAYPNGQVALQNIEWDTYTPVLLTGQSYIVKGTSPIQKIDVLPDTSQTFTIILDSLSSASLLVIVKDASTKAPLEGASLTLVKGGSGTLTYTGSTGGSVWMQNDWSGGPGLDTWDPSNPKTYFKAIGSIAIGNGSNDVELQKVSGKYLTNATSTLESSTFDTGTSATDFTTIDWLPTSQDISTTLAIQLASNNDQTTWNYVGPDGTANTYYTVPGTNINSFHNNKRYIRYRAYLFTSNDKKTPYLSSIKINYVSGCYTPGQYLFRDVSPTHSEAPYTLTVSLPGYQTANVSIPNGIHDNQAVEVLLSPQ